MERLNGDARVPDHLRGGVVAIGNFDGFHRGHQAVVGRAVMRARAEGRPALVATFDPHPARLFRPDAPPFLLSTIDQRLRWFADAGADATYVIDFSATLASIPAEDFVTAHLVGRIGATAIVTGEDFTFGRDREGDIAALARLGAACGLNAEGTAAVSDAGGIISSTRIRALLAAGDPRAAAGLLTRPFTVEGAVRHGAHLGRSIGYPTANLVLEEYLRPAYGVYAVRGRLPEGAMADGVANLGTRPMITPATELLEPHFFDFAGDLYDRTIAVELVDYLRPEWVLSDLPALERQIAADCALARTRLAAPTAAH